MKEIVVLSGKGGTGKTSIVGSFAALVKNKVLVDCDVDAAVLHLLLNPTIKQDGQFWSGKVAVIDEQKCIQCDLCQDLCRFHAIKDYQVDPISCEGCGFCSQLCAVEAITMKENLAGHLFISDTRYGTLAHASLNIAQENSGKLVAQVRQFARQIAQHEKADYIICDGPPGIGCPVISSLSSANLALLVTEPTLSGIHDLERVLSVCRHFNIPSVVCINKFDINEENSLQIENFCQKQGIIIAAKIPFDTVVTEALGQGMPVVEYSEKSMVTNKIKNMWVNMLDCLN